MKIEDILFWIIMMLIIGLAIWKIVGSPTDTATLIAVTLFIASSEILIWKAIFSADKKTAVGFEKIKSKLDIIDNKLNNIQLLIKK